MQFENNLLNPRSTTMAYTERETVTITLERYEQMKDAATQREGERRLLQVYRRYIEDHGLAVLYHQQEPPSIHTKEEAEIIMGKINLQ